jgi:hypothetical protein
VAGPREEEEVEIKEKEVEEKEKTEETTDFRNEATKSTEGNEGPITGPVGRRPKAAVWW